MGVYPTSSYKRLILPWHPLDVKGFFGVAGREVRLFFARKALPPYFDRKTKACRYGRLWFFAVAV